MTTIAPQAKPDSTQLLAQADLLLLAAGLIRPPMDAASCAAEELAALLDAAGADPVLREAVHRVVALKAEELAPDQRTPAANSWGLVDEYYRLFEGAMVCPPNESAFIRRDKGAILADISGFYSAFGFKSSDRAGEKLDHICCELEFAAALLVMLACACQVGHEDQQAVTRDALADFVAAHLGAWLRPFTAHLKNSTVLPSYAAVADLLEELWRWLSASHGWAAPEPNLASPAEDLGSPYECGMAENENRVALTIGGREAPGPSRS